MVGANDTSLVAEERCLPHCEQCYNGCCGDMVCYGAKEDPPVIGNCLHPGETPAKAKADGSCPNIFLDEIAVASGGRRKKRLADIPDDEQEILEAQEFAAGFENSLNCSAQFKSC